MPAESIAKSDQRDSRSGGDPTCLATLISEIGNKDSKQGLLRFTYDELRNDTFSGSNCSTCQSFKAVRAPKGQVMDRATEDLAMIHIDLAGPFLPSANGKKYLVVIVDDRSGAVAAVAVKEKSEVLDSPVLDSLALIISCQRPGQDYIVASFIVAI